MKIKDVIGPEQVEVGLRVSDKSQLLRELSRRAAAAASIDQNVIHDALMAARNWDSLALVRALPCPTPDLTHYPASSRCFVRLARPIDFAEIDGQPVDLVILLLTPANAGNQHLATLAALSRPLRDADFVQCLRRAPDVEITYRLLANA